MNETFGLGLNARRIVADLRREGPMSRADLARLLDITPSTVTRITGQMIADGLLSEMPDPNRLGRKGYPARLLDLKPEGLCTAGVYLDPDRIMTCIATLSGEVLVHQELPVRDRTFEGIMTVAGQSVRDLVEEVGTSEGRLAGCGVSYPGMYSADPTQVMRIRQFRDWPSVNVRRDLSPWFGMPVQHQNDAKAACLAELYFGAARHLSNFCFVWLSYGIGGAAVVEQRVYPGRNNSAAEWGGLFPKSLLRPSGQDLLDTLARAGHPLDRLQDIDATHLALPTVEEWQRRASQQLRWLCLVIARTFAPEAIVFGGTLHPAIIDRFIVEIGSDAPLGEDFHSDPPRLLRASRDQEPQLGPASLPLHSVLSPSAYEGQARKGT